MKKRILISNATVTGFHDEVSFSGLNVQKFSQKRVSHIWPASRLLRVCFRLMRLLVSDRSRMANWTRSWSCRWIVRIGPDRFGPFTDRSSAIRFEKDHIFRQLADI